MLRRTCLLAAATLWLSGLCAAQQTLTGYLMDRACSPDAVKKGEKVAKEHGVDCALMGDCVKSGYGVLLPGGKFVTFDAAGNKRALAALKATKKQNDLQVTVTGEVAGDTIQVTALKLM